MTALVRVATPADADAVTAAYAAGIAGRLATFETVPPPPEVMAERIATTQPPHAFLVAEVDRAVVGWAATSAYSARPVYSGIAEYSVYVGAGAQGRGVGRALLAGLLQRSRTSGLHKVIGRVFPENAASLALCASLGFREVGTHVDHAQLDGAWRDVVVVEALLRESETFV